MVTHILHIVDKKMIYIMITAIFCVQLLLAANTKNGKLYKSYKKEEMAVMEQYEHKMLQCKLSSVKTGLCSMYNL